jgi:hypothetical protein
VADIKTSTTHRLLLEPRKNTIRDGRLTMEPLIVCDENRPDVPAPPMMAAFRVQPIQKPKTMLIQVDGELTDESLVALYQTSRGYPTPAVTIVDLSAATGSAVSCDFIRKLANQKAAIADIDSLLFIVAPQPYLYGLCRMFQTLREGRVPMIVIVHTLDEAFVALGIEPPRFEPLAIPA